MAANIKNYAYVLTAEDSKRIHDIKPVDKTYLDECRAVAEKYPKREKREVKK